MRPGQVVLIALVCTAIGALSGVALHSMREAEEAIVPAAVQRISGVQLDALPDFSYPDLAGNTRSRSDWADRILVLNFWASWCPPCREETPAFIALQDEFADQGVQFVGIAIDDKEPVREFASSFGINYPILLGDIRAIEMSRKLGNRFEGLPFTVVAGRDGNVTLRHAGGLSRAQLLPVLKELLGDG